MNLRTGSRSMCLIGICTAMSFGQSFVSFNAPKLFPAEGMALVSGDFNGDGKLDVAVANPHQSVLVLLGAGEGTLQPPASYAIPGTTETAFVTGDFNGDGKLDLAIACAQCAPGSGIAVLLNRGDGTFQPASLSPLGELDVGYAMAVADFNGDGKLDLAIVDTAGNVLLALGNGDGTFRAATNIWPNAYALNIAAADLNADGHADLVVTSGQTFTPVQPGEVSILLGAGNGSFAAPVSYSVGSGPGAAPMAWPSVTSTEMALSIWPSPTTPITTSRFCWARAMARSPLLSIIRRARGRPRSSPQISMAMERWIWRWATNQAPTSPFSRDRETAPLRAAPSTPHRAPVWRTRWLRETSIMTAQWTWPLAG